MEVSLGKLSNYIGQAKGDLKLSNHFSMIDKDLQNLWRTTNDVVRRFGDSLNLRPNLVQTVAKVAGVPTQVTREINVGYSMPIWSTPANADEELHFRTRIPYRWDGTTDPQLGMAVSLSAGEDVGDRFKFQLEWQTTNQGNVIGTTTSSSTSEQIVLAGRADAYDAYFIFFNFNADDTTNPIVAGQMLQSRVRRVAASASEVTGEVIIWDWSTIWKTDKIYGTWTAHTNAT